MSREQNTVCMFVNGQAMRGGPLNDALVNATFRGPTRTAAKYRFYSFNDEFPGLCTADGDEGWHVPGELYEVTYADLYRDLLPREPEELELSVVQLENGSHSLSMVCRREPVDMEAQEITVAGGWREHLGITI